MNTLNDAIANADQQKIIDTLTALKFSDFPHRRWLSGANHYQLNAAGKLRAVNRVTMINPQSADLTQYISISTLIHNLDGWTYLGESIGAYLDGNNAGALHLAYYAELRGALSFLACQGIGIFESKHYYVDCNGQCYKFNKDGNFKSNVGSGTHQITWSILEEWARQNSNIEYFTKNIFVKGISIYDWLSEFLGNPASIAMAATGIIQQLLSTWCMDIQELTKDRNARNFCSYSPQKIMPPANHAFDMKLRDIIDLTKLLEPSGPTEKYKLLDSYILKSVLILGYQQVLGSPGDFDARIQNTCANLGVTDIELLGLLRGENRLHKVFIEGKGPALNTSDQVFPFPIICRALLTSRIATMACFHLIKNTGINKTDLEFWIGEIMESDGLGDFASIGDLADLWIDKKEAIDEIGKLFAISPNAGILEANLYNAFDLWQLRKIQSSCFWGAEY
jgi:hypothetical protein